MILNLTNYNKYYNKKCNKKAKIIHLAITERVILKNLSNKLPKKNIKKNLILISTRVKVFSF
jgi:hypothetical protein